VGDPGGRERRGRRRHDRSVLHAAVRHRRANHHRVPAVSARVRVHDGRTGGVQQVAHIVRAVHAQHAPVPGHPVPAGPARGQSHTRS